MSTTAKLREDSTETVKIGEHELQLLRRGDGPPLLVLHEELGFPGWMGWNAELARERTQLLPMHPGFGRTPYLEWIRSVRDLGGFYARWLREQRLAPIDVLGFSFGGWIAAEMAASDPSLFRRMVLVAPFGIKPTPGELILPFDTRLGIPPEQKTSPEAIVDMFAVPALEYLQLTVNDPRATAEYETLFGGAPTPEQFEAFEDARAEAARLGWQPYMNNPSLPHLLEGVTNLPTLLIWGDSDRIVPLRAAERYQRAIQGSKLAIIENCGHRPEIEQPQRFLTELRNFLTEA